MTARTEAAAAVLRLGRRAAYATAVVTPIGLAFLVAMYVSFAVGAKSEGLAFGWVNDVLAVVTGVLMVPIAIAVHVLLRERAPQGSWRALIVGLGANVAIVILQSLLVAGVLTFEQEIGPVLVAFLALVVWFVATGRIGRSTGLLPNGLRMSVLAATYIAFPFWAVWLARHLIRQAGEPASAFRADIGSRSRDRSGIQSNQERPGHGSAELIRGRLVKCQGHRGRVHEAVARRGDRDRIGALDRLAGRPDGERG
jgi:hypothetical protein